MCSYSVPLLACVSFMMAVFTPSFVAQGAPRVANTTLAFPQEPFTYRLVTAFPGLLFDGAVAFASPPGETNRLFIAERGGTIQVIANLANPNKTVFLDISSQVNASGEGGLVGLTFHPGYATNRLFFVFYTLDTSTAAGTGFHNRISRFETSPSNPNLAVSGSEVPLITQFDEEDNHNAGDMHFGPDGYLYVSLGDEGDSRDSLGNSQLITKDFFSAILRLDVDLKPGSLPPNPHPAVSGNYAVPADNPFVGATSFNGQSVDPAKVRTEFWAVGFRNPWRFRFDSVTGRLFCADVGESAREEINIVVKGGNYGWKFREGSLDGSGIPPAGVSFIEPILDYPQGSGSLQGNSVVGGLVYRGSNLAQLHGEYIFGDYSSGNIWALSYDGTSATNFRRLTGMPGLAAFGIDPSNQDILVCDPFPFSPILRLVQGTQGNVPLPAKLSDAGAFQNLAALTPHPGIVDYDINTPFWSDYATKRRWFSIPELNQFMTFSVNDNWSYPDGSVWIKHFDLEMTNGVPSSARRVETRFIVKMPVGMYGLTYRWNAAQTDATLVDENGFDETFQIRDGGGVRSQVWHYPSRSECLTCHTQPGGYALGFNTHQLNRNRDEAGSPVNQITLLSQMGYFSNPPGSTNGWLAYAHSTNSSASLDHRVRSYLGANCAYCHHPNGTGRGNWDGRLQTPLAQAGIVNGGLIDNFGDTGNKVIAAGSLENSMIFNRVSQLGNRHMPPLGTSELDLSAIAMLSQWITSEVVGARIASSAVEPDGRMRILYSGVAGRTYRVEVCDDFLSWQTIGTSQSSANGTGNFLDPVAITPGAGVRFYRFAWP